MPRPQPIHRRVARPAEKELQYHVLRRIVIECPDLEPYRSTLALVRQRRDAGQSPVVWVTSRNQLEVR